MTAKMETEVLKKIQKRRNSLRKALEVGSLRFARQSFVTFALPLLLMVARFPTEKQKKLQMGERYTFVSDRFWKLLIAEFKKWLGVPK